MTPVDGWYTQTQDFAPFEPPPRAAILHWPPNPLLEGPMPPPPLQQFPRYPAPRIRTYDRDGKLLYDSGDGLAPVRQQLGEFLNVYKEATCPPHKS